jgi:ABC-type nitrate/sulfonate/bicarbonate transport system substrate-binding protein
MTVLRVFFTALLALTILPFSSVEAQRANLIAGYLAAPAMLPLFVADQAGHFREEGLGVTSVLFRSGVQVAQTIISGDVHIGLASPPEVVTAVNAGAKIKGVWGISNLMPFALISRPNIRTIGDLKGKKLAISSHGALSDFLTQHTLREKGVDPRDVTLIAMGGVPTRFAALLSGAADASLISSAHFGQAKKEGLHFLLMLSELIPEWPLDVIYVREDFIANRDADLRAFLRAYRRGLITAKAKPDFAIAALQKVLRYEPAAAAEGYHAYIKSLPEDGYISERGMELLIQQLHESGTIKRKLALNELFDYRYIREHRKK